MFSPKLSDHHFQPHSSHHPHQSPRQNQLETKVIPSGMGRWYDTSVVNSADSTKPTNLYETFTQNIGVLYESSRAHMVNLSCSCRVK